MDETIKEVKCPYCHGKGKVPLRMDDGVISVPLGWFREYEDLQDRLSYLVNILKKLQRKDKESEPKISKEGAEGINSEARL